MSQPIRVLQVFAQMNRGGAETMIMNLYRNIDRTKIQFDFIVHTDEQCAFDEEIKLLGGKIYRVPRYTGKNHIQYLTAWRSFFETHINYKIIHGHVRSTAAIYLNLANKHGLTTIAHSHSTSSGKGLPALAKNILQLPIRNIADYLFACSKNAGEWLYGKKACKSEKFFLLNNAIEVEKFLFNEDTRIQKRKELTIEDKFVVGHIGRFNTVKNHSFLIDIFREVHKENNNSVLLLVGDGELRSKMEQKVMDLGLSDNVLFTGLRTDVSELLQAMDVFVFPSLYEGLPVTLIEAQASGVNCIISDTISKEVKISNKIQFCSLKNPPEYWAKMILNNIDRSTENIYEEVSNAGYNVKNNARWLEDFYLSNI